MHEVHAEDGTAEEEEGVGLPAPLFAAVGGAGAGVADEAAECKEDGDPEPETL